MKRVIGWTFLIYAILVGINYISLSIGGLFTYNRPTQADELASIDFSFFGKNGIGRSYITQGYGKTSYSYAYAAGWHNGIDIAAVYGAPVYSPYDGVVLATGNQDNFCPNRGFGKYIALKDDAEHIVLWFAHLGRFAVSPGDVIKKGSLLGYVGATGLETGTHLHFSIFDANGFTMTARNGCGPDATGHDVNPLNYL